MSNHAIQRIPMVGKTFGLLTVLSFSHLNENRRAVWICRCGCGREHSAPGYSLRAGTIKSCGCWKNRRRTIHGACYSKLYSIWKEMRKRCHRPSNPHFERYGGRGISVCKEWYGSFLIFRDWALSHGYSEGLTIDRKDNDGNYEPSNCQWLTRPDHSRKTAADGKKQRGLP